MAVLYACGWEAGLLATYQAERWATTGLVAIVTTAEGQHKSATGVGGNYALRCNASLQGGRTPAFLPNTARWVHAFVAPIAGSAAASIGVVQAGTAQFNVQLLANGNVLFKRATTTVKTTVGGWNPLASHWVAVFFDCRESPNGLCEVWIDGVFVDSFSGDTRNTSVDQWDAIALHSESGGGNLGTGTTYYDDIIVTTAATGRLPELFGCPIVPNLDTAQKDLTPSVGTDNFANVNVVPTDTVTFNSAAATGDEDRYDLQASPAAASIAFINVFAYASRDGAINTGEISIESGAAIEYGTPTTLAASPAYLGMTHIWATDPNTTLAWQTAGINALKAGFRFTAV